MGGHGRCFPTYLVSLRWSPLHEVIAGSPINFIEQTQNILIVDSRVNLLTNRQHQAVTFLLPETSCSSVTVIRLLPPPLIVVSALFGGCNTAGSLPSTGLSEPGPDEAADPASALLRVADPATLLLVALGFPSKPLTVLLTTLSVVWAGVGAGVWVGAGAYLCPHVHNEVLPKRIPKNQKDQRTKNEHEKKSRYILGDIPCTR